MSAINADVEILLRRIYLFMKFVVRNGFKPVCLFEKCVISRTQIFYGVLIILLNSLVSK